MKSLNIFNQTVVTGLIFCLSLSSCYEQQDPLEEMITRTGNHYPVVANIRTLEAQGFEVDQSPGGEVNLELQYWSFDPIDQINLYDVINNDTSLVSSFEYQPAFSKRAGTDTLVVNYTVPQVNSGTRINLLFEVVNENTLTDFGNYSFTVE
jgi:hypothetical protein